MDGMAASLSEASLRELTQRMPNLLFAVSASSAASSAPPWPAQTVHPEDEAALALGWKKANEDGDPFDCCVRLKAPAGDYRRSDVHVMPLRDVNGAVSCWVATKLQSEPERAPGLDAIELLRAVCDTAPDAIFVKDTRGRYLYANPTCARLFSVTASEIIGTDDDKWFGAIMGAHLRAEDCAAMEHGSIALDEELPVAGKHRHFSTTKVPFHDGAGRVLGVVGIARDVQADRRAAQAIRAERDMYAMMATVVPGAFASYRLRPDGSFEIPHATASIVELFGATPAELAADPGIPRERTHPDDRPRVDDAIAHSAHGLSPLRCEFRVLHPRRGEIWVEIVSGPLREPDGSILWHGFVLDITERKRTERELAEERDRLNGIAMSSPGALFAFHRAADGSLSYPYVSLAMARVHGVPVEKIRRDAASVVALVHPDDIERVQANIELSASTLSTWRCEYRINNPERGEIWVEGHSQPVRDAAGGITWNGTVTDITERRLGEARLRASESTLRAVVETVPDFLMLVDRDRKIAFINHLLTGLVLHDVVGSDPLEHVAPSMREAAKATMERVFATAEMQSYEAFAGSPTSGMRWFHTRIGPVIDNGEVVAVALASTDVTARKLAEDQVRKSEERYRKLVELLPDAVFVTNGDAKITFCNAAFVRLIGAGSAEELLGLTPFNLLHPDGHADVKARIELMRTTGLPVPASEKSVVRLDGTSRRVSVVAAPITTDGAVSSSWSCTI